MRPIARTLIRCYPPSFRSRYGEELEALVEDLGSRWRTGADLAWGAMRAWCTPRVAGPQRLGWRRRATVSTLWVTWCLAALGAPATSKALLDPPAPGVGAAVRVLMNLVQINFVLGWLLALLAAVPLAVRAIRSVRAARRGRDLRPLIPALVLGVVEVVGFLLLRDAAGPSRTLAGADLVGALAWLAGLAGLVLAMAWGPALALSRVELDPGALVWAMRWSRLQALNMVAMAVVCLSAVVLDGHATIFSNVAVADLVVAGVAVCAVTAVVSTCREWNVAR